MFKRLSIQIKIALIIVSITFFTLGTGYFFIVRNMLLDLKTNLESTAIKNAELFAEYSIVPLAFADTYQAEKNMEVLNKVPTIDAAILFNSDHQVFVIYQKEGSNFLPDSAEYKLQSTYFGDHYVVNTPVQKENLVYGYIMLWVSTDALRTEIKKNILVFTLALFILLFVSFGLASLFQRVITAPVLNLAEVMDRITTDQDFSMRVEKNSYDEIGRLYDGFNRMIEEIHRTQIELQESESKFKSYIESAPDGILVINQKRKIVEINTAVTKLTGIQRAELIGLNIAKLLPSFPVTTKVTQLINEKTEHPSITFDTEYISPDNKLFYWSASVIRLRDNHLLGFFKDITIRKNSEFEVRRLRNYLLNIIDSMPSVIIGIDHSQKISQWNKQAELYTNISRDEALGQNLRLIFPSIAEDVESLSLRQDNIYEPANKKKTRLINGVERHENITIYPLSKESAKGAVIRIDDVTEMTKLEEMMIQSEKMLSVGGLAAGMAHEINNPLAGMIQNANLIQSRLTAKLPANKSTADKLGLSLDVLKLYMQERGIIKQLQMITDSGKRAARIVQNMLSFSRKNDSTNLPVDLACLLNTTIELAQNDYLLKKKYDFRNIKILRDYDSNLPMVRCDDSKIQQVLLNLMKNGAYAMATKMAVGYQPEFRFRMYHEDNNLVTVIEDNGPGMNTETQKHIFEPFYTTKAVGEGSGLGLSVSYFIIKENHHGEMLVESKPGEGTKFIIKLPINS